MTTISSSTGALSSLVSLYATSDDSSGTSLTQAQKQNVVTMLEGDGNSASSGGLSALLGTSDTSTSSTDLSSILDAIQAQTDASVAGTSPADGTTGTATTEQQKAATLMQSVYQSQQSNLFTLLG